MYQPSHARFIEKDVEELYRLVRNYPLGTLITWDHADGDANHIPFLLNVGPTQTLTAHVPRSNPVWRALTMSPVLVVFHGPNAYISPSWYPSKQTHGRAVPTWNYAVVHARGKARAIEDKEWLRAHLDQLTSTHEKNLERAWKIGDAPHEYIDELLGAIVGIEIEVESLSGKFKLGQNRPLEDQRSVASKLEGRHLELANLTRERIKA